MCIEEIEAQTLRSESRPAGDNSLKAGCNALDAIEANKPVTASPIPPCPMTSANVIKIPFFASERYK